MVEIETIAIAARAAWRSAEQAHQATRDENRAFFENFRKLAEHHAERLKHLEARYEQSEHETRDLVLQANRRIAEYQAMVERFTRTTRRIALSAFAVILIALILLEISWWVN